MQETRNNSFGSKKCSMTLLQAKTGKHECQNVTAMYIAVTFRHVSAVNFLKFRYLINDFREP